METITSRENPRIKRVAKLLGRSGFRRETGFFVCEGARLCLDALSSAEVAEVYLTEESLRRYPELSRLAENAGQAFLIGEGAAGKLADTRTTQGVFAVCRMLDNRESAVKIKGDGRYILLSSLQDPGNLGTILRTAEAFGMDGVFLSQDCPDLYSPKVLRGCMGGVFRLPVAVAGDLADTVTRLREQGIAVYAAALRADAVPPMRLGEADGAAVLIGNEGNGLSASLRERCEHCVRIPMAGGAQSLNAGVAASVLMWEMVRRKLEVSN